jgi:TLC domain
MTPITNIDTTSNTPGSNSTSSQPKAFQFPQSQSQSFILHFWITQYRNTPKFYIWRDIGIGFTLASAMILFGIRLLGDFYFEASLGWPRHSKRKKDAAAGVASIVHAVTLVTSLGVLLWSQPYSPSSNTSKQTQETKDATTALLQFCTGYMLYDALGMVMDNWNTGGLTGGDGLFIAHHIATSFCMISCLVIGAGHHSVLMLMFLGELTNPLGSLHSITRYAIQLEGPETFWHTLHPYVEWTFAASYGVIRALVAPAFLMHMTFDLLGRGRRNVPLSISLVWLFLMWGVIIGSIPWTREAIDMALDGVHVVKYNVDYDYGPRYEL